NKAVAAPRVRPATSVIVRQLLPAAAIGRVVLAPRSPLPLGEVGTPALPVALATRVLLEPDVLRGASSPMVRRPPLRHRLPPPSCDAQSLARRSLNRRFTSANYAPTVPPLHLETVTERPSQRYRRTARAG